MPHGIDSGPGLVAADSGVPLPTKATAPFLIAGMVPSRGCAWMPASSEASPYMTMSSMSETWSAFSEASSR